MGADIAIEAGQGHAELAEGGCGVRIVLVHVRREQPGGHVQGSDLVEAEGSAHEVGVPVDFQLAAVEVVLVDAGGKIAMRHVLAHGSAADAEPVGNPGGGKAFGMRPKELFDLRQALDFQLRLVQRSPPLFVTCSVAQGCFHRGNYGDQSARLLSHGCAS